jgi:hypothetical protein
VNPGDLARIHVKRILGEFLDVHYNSWSTGQTKFTELKSVGHIIAFCKVPDHDWFLAYVLFPAAFGWLYVDQEIEVIS